jgi:hypothetical protein
VPRETAEIVVVVGRGGGRGGGDVEKRDVRILHAEEIL